MPVCISLCPRRLPSHARLPKSSSSLPGAGSTAFRSPSAPPAPASPGRPSPMACSWRSAATGSAGSCWRTDAPSAPSPASAQGCSMPSCAPMSGGWVRTLHQWRSAPLAASWQTTPAGCAAGRGKPPTGPCAGSPASCPTGLCSIPPRPMPMRSSWRKRRSWLRACSDCAPVSWRVPHFGSASNGSTASKTPSATA